MVIRFNKILAWSVFLGINLLLFLNLTKIYEFSWANDRIRLMIYIFLGGVSVLLLIRSLILKRPSKINSFGKTIIAYTVMLAISLVLHSNMDIEVWLNCFIVLFALISSFYAFHEYNIIKKAFELQYCLLLIMFFMFIYSKLFLPQSGAGKLNSVFYVVLLLPFVLCIEKNMKRNIGIILILFASLVSLKRTAVVIVGVTFILYYLSRDEYGKTKVIKLLVMILIILLSLYYVQTYMNIDIISKFENISEDGGSGRSDIYDVLLDNFFERDFRSILLGNGYYSVINIIGGTAHNDFLEIAFDFGVIGIFFYLMIYVSLITNYIKMKKCKYRFSNQFLISIAIFFIMSMLSHVIMIPTYFMFIAIFWGLILADQQREKVELHENRKYYIS